MYEEEIKKIGEYRKSGRYEEAEGLLRFFIEKDPKNPKLNYNMACILDNQGREDEAVQYYENAISNSLGTEDLLGALLGLGSSLKVLGRLEESNSIFLEAMRQFPEKKELLVFHALTLFEMKEYEVSFNELIGVLLETTKDEGILNYRKAIESYKNEISK